MEEFTDTLRLFDTRQLDKDTAVGLETLDVRLYDTKAVDTGTKYVERVVDGTLDILTQNGQHLFVSRGGVDASLHFEGAEDGRQAGTFIQSLIFFNEKVDVVLVGLSLTA